MRDKIALAVSMVAAWGGIWVWVQLVDWVNNWLSA